MPDTLPPIVIRVIPPTAQRYETVGDWTMEGETLVISVSDTGNPDHAFLVAIHEFVEWYLCQRRGISAGEVDRWDKQWEVTPNPAYDEPGDDPDAPYHHDHVYASALERLVAHELGVEWEEYEAALDRAMAATKAKA